MARNKGHSLYFVCILPPDDIGMQLTAFKEEIANQYGSNYALRLPPHITLIPPFEYPDSGIEHVTECQDKALWGTPQFTINLNGFGCFSNRVIYIDTVRTAALSTLYLTLVKAYKELGKNIDASRPFNPHMTIANRDLTPTRFDAAWPAFANRAYQAQFEVNAIHLLKHIGGRWQLFHESPLH